MKKTRSMFAWVVVTTMAMAGLGASGVAQARSDVTWSIGVGVPGVVVGNGYQGYPGYAPPAYYPPPRPVYYAPPPVYYAPPPPVYYAPRPVYYGPPVMVRPPGHGYYGGRYYQQRPHRHHRHRDRDDD